MKRTIVSLAMAAALVLPAAIGHVRPAAADYGVNISCPMQQPSFSGTFEHRVYHFTLTCYGGQNFQITASYDNTNQQASERFIGTDASQGYSLEASWTCPTDPWGTYQEPVCTNTGTTIEPARTGFLGGYDVSSSTLPYSTQSISDQDRGTLWEEATQAERQQAQQPQASPPTNFDQHAGDVTTCVACGSAEAMPDFQASHLTSTVCVACAAAAANPSPSPSLSTSIGS